MAFRFQFVIDKFTVSCTESDFFQKYDLEKHDQNPVSSTRTGIITDTVAYCKAV